VDSDLVAVGGWTDGWFIGLWLGPGDVVDYLKIRIINLSH